MSSDVTARAGAGTPIVTGHAAERWDERTPADSVAPEAAWRHGQRIRAAERPTRSDECRLHHPTRTLLLRQGSRIVTVLLSAECTQDVQRAIPTTPNP